MWMDLLIRVLQKFLVDRVLRQMVLLVLQLDKTYCIKYIERFGGIASVGGAPGQGDHENTVAALP